MLSLSGGSGDEQTVLANISLNGGCQVPKAAVPQSPGQARLDVLDGAELIETDARGKGSVRDEPSPSFRKLPHQAELNGVPQRAYPAVPADSEGRFIDLQIILANTSSRGSRLTRISAILRRV
jgi:hypothetical protein